MSPSSRTTAWIFDLDGTLTIAAHDFDAIRAELGLPEGQPIIEAMARLDDAVRLPMETRLRAIELEIAARSRPAVGALAVLDRLRGQGIPAGIVTRNTRVNARVTLEAAGLRQFFVDEEIIGRDEAPAKPDPGGLRLLIERWAVDPGRTSMVGDFRFDLIAARNAGARAVYVDPTGAFIWREHADRCVRTLDELMTRE